METTEIKSALDEMKNTVTGRLDEMSRNHNELKTKYLALSDSLIELAQKGTAMKDVDLENHKGGLVNKVVKAFQENADLISKSPQVRLEIKAAGDVLTTSHARTVQSGGVGIPSGSPLGVFNALPTRVIGQISAVEYSRFLALEGAAAKQSAEGAAKSAVRPTFSLITETAATIAGYTKISKQALNDSAELANAINTTLVRSIGTALDTFLNSGTWGGAAGLLAHATAYTSLVYTSLADAVSEGVATMQIAGFSPDVVVLTPSDWLAITVAKGTANDHYLSGSYLGDMPLTLRGLRVVLSPTITSGKALILDSSHFELQIVEDLTIEIGTDGDDFTKNIRTILGEMRVIPTFRAVGAGRLITPKAPEEEEEQS